MEAIKRRLDKLETKHEAGNLFTFSRSPDEESRQAFIMKHGSKDHILTTEEWQDEFCQSGREGGICQAP